MSKKVTRSRKTIVSKKPKKVRQLVSKPFADNTLSNSAFFSLIRSALREKSRWWFPIKVCRQRAKVAYTGTSKRKKWLYKCEMCGGLFDAKDTVVHHLIECGSLSSFEDLPRFTKNLFCDSKDLTLICLDCHTKVHEHEKV